MRRRKRRKQKKIIIISTLSLLLFLCIGYAAFSTNLSLTAKGNIKEKSRVIQSWEETSQTDFHSDFYKENIVSVTFLDNNNVPSNKIESWNISEDKKHGGVLAWVIPNNNDNTKYDLYIGAKDGVIANIDSSFLFYNFQNIKEINFNNNYDTSNTLIMRAMFKNCLNMETIDISSFNTKNVTDIHDMFAMWDEGNAKVMDNKLTNIIFGENFNTSNVQTIAQMFIGCNKLTNLNIENWNTSNVTDMSSVFSFCTNLKELNLSKWNTSNVGSMSWMFKGCTNLKTLNIDNFDTSKVTGMYQMFHECTSLTNLNLCSFNTKNVKEMGNMFYHMINITQIKVGSGWTTSGADTTNMFSYSGVSEVTRGQC